MENLFKAPKRAWHKYFVSRNAIILTGHERIAAINALYRRADDLSTYFLFNESEEKIYTNKELFALLEKQYRIAPNKLMILVDNVNKFCKTYIEFNALMLASATIQNSLAKNTDVNDEFWWFAKNHS